MAKSRASIFGQTDEALKLDLGGFEPKKRSDPNAPPAEKVREVSLAAQFKSREAQPVKTEGKPDRTPRIHRTGRNVQFNVKASRETVDAIYAITDAHPGWVLGYTLERAVAALKREMESQS
ncbi:MAG TPA: hypothetical protein VG672_15800 [Bryobacteraceae bacterium]|jgi:hypothetical protein|nr:hypothetical protein [Bryobacteraceae bacterium]